MLTVVHVAESSNENDTAGGSLLDEIVREGTRATLALRCGPRSRRMSNSSSIGSTRTAAGWWCATGLVVRNGYHDERAVLTAAGARRGAAGQRPQC